MQRLHGDLLRQVADRLPARDARRLGRALPNARAEAAASVAARSALNRRVDRATTAVGELGREVMAAVTRMLHSLETSVPGPHATRTRKYGRVLVEARGTGRNRYGEPVPILGFRVSIVDRNPEGEILEARFGVNPRTREVFRSPLGHVRLGSLTTTLLKNMTRRAFETNGYFVRSFR